MPETEVVLFQEGDGTVLLIEWLDKLPGKVQEKCIVKIQRLEQMGHQLRRPEADILKHGIYELRVAFRGIQYRILYFFHGKQAIISHGLIKESIVPQNEINLAIVRKDRFENNPAKHTYRETLL